MTTLTVRPFRLLLTWPLRDLLKHTVEVQWNEQMCHYNSMLKGQFTPKKKYIFSLFPVELFINLDSFGVSCLVSEISAVEISAFSLI